MLSDLKAKLSTKRLLAIVLPIVIVLFAIYCRFKGYTLFSILHEANIETGHLFLNYVLPLFITLCGVHKVISISYPITSTIKVKQPNNASTNYTLLNADTNPVITHTFLHFLQSQQAILPFI